MYEKFWESYHLQSHGSVEAYNKQFKNFISVKDVYREFWP